jgi:hypothetical protein
MQDKLHELSYQLTAANGEIFLWIFSGVAIVIALIILFDPFKRKHKEYRYPGDPRRFSFKINPFAFFFRRTRGLYRNLNEEIENRRRNKPEDHR